MKRIVFAVLAILFSGVSLGGNESVQEWRFGVYLDDDRIGYHHFRIEHAENRMQAVINAKFNVKFLFFNAYQYVHDNMENWRGGCLQQLESSTDDNGQLFNVRANKEDEALVVESLEKETTFAGCVKTFAYWDASILTADKLLNAQTGEYVDIKVTDLGSDEIKVKGKPTPANRYRLTGQDLTIDLWYSEKRQWLALESPTKGRTLRYLIQ